MTISAFLVLALTTAFAQDTGFVEPPVVGGTPVVAGTWQDTVLVVTRDSICTGTLVGPQTVVTAAHCNDQIQGILVGTLDYNTNNGTWYPAVRSVNHPSYASSQWGGYDIAVTLLQSPVTNVTPRAFAVDCAAPEIVNGAPVHIVGYGGTRADGGGNNSRLNEGSTVITDVSCNDPSCDPNMVAGEFMAGANGVDSCFGDSGGPLYLNSGYGYLLLGVTSRGSYAAQQTGYVCGGNGIYTRADTFIDWIQSQTTDTMLRPICNVPPVITVESFGQVGNKGNSRTTFTITDPDSTSWTYELPVPPANGRIEVAEGQLTYTGDGLFVGRDAFTFRVTDDAGNIVDTEVPLVIAEGKSCGCATGGQPLGLWTLGFAGLLLVRRRQS